MKRSTFRSGCVIAGATAVSAFLSGCLGGPTYGTGTSQNVQLLQDITSIASIGSPGKNQKTDYKPRPEIVEPPEGATLPQPQQSLASKDNPAWLESPEETRARLRETASVNRDRKPYTSPLASPDDNVSSEQWQQFREAKANAKGAYSDRRTLSDPPMAYREPADTAPVGELGESEYDKEKRREAEAKEKKSFKLWPF